MFKSAKASSSKASKSGVAQPRQEQCVALCDYYTANDEEISFKRGDVITVVTKGNDSGFWSGYVAATSMAGSRKAAKERESNHHKSDKDKAVIVAQPAADGKVPQLAPNGAKIGLFPNCMVTSNCRLKAGEKSFLNKAAALYSYEPKDMTEMRFEKYDVMTIVGPSPHNGWWLAVNESARKRMLAEAQESAARGEAVFDTSGTVMDTVAGTVDKPLLVPTNFLTCDIVIAMYGFQGREKHELSFAAGDVLHVKRKWNDGWWEAILNGQRGIFPSNYTDPNVCTLPTPLFCGHCKAIFASATQGALGDCKNCGRHEEIVQTMKRALEGHFDAIKDREAAVEARPGGFESLTQKEKDSLAKKARRCNLFEFIELDPKVGGRSALLTPADIIKSAGGGVGKGVAGVASGLAKLHFSHQNAHDGNGDNVVTGMDPDAYADAQINDEEIFHRRGETKSVLAEMERKRAEAAAAAVAGGGERLSFEAGSYGRV